MQFMQSRRDFLASASLAGGRWRPWRPGIARRRGAAGGDHGPAAPVIPASASRPGTSARTCCVRRDSPISATCREVGPCDRAVDRKRRDRFRSLFRGSGRLSPGCRPADHGAGGCACRLLRAVRARADSHHQRPEGQESRHSDALGSGTHLYVAIMAANIGLDPAEDIDWVTPGPTGTPMELFAERKSRCVPRDSRPSRRSCAPARSAA